MLSYEFMQKAFLVGILLSIIIPIVGQTCVLKRLSTKGDALSHTALLGVALGLVSGISPIIVALITCVIASIIIEFIRKRFSKYSELSVAIVMSFSIAMAAILSNFSKSGNFESYLFGSIILIKNSEIILTIIIFVLTLLFYIGFYHQIMYISYNEVQAKLDGVNVSLINMLETIITGVIIAISSKIIGALMVSALMIIPYASAMQITRSYKKSIIISIFFSIISMVSGLICSYYLNFQPGGTIVIISIIILVLSMGLNKKFKFVK